MSSADRVTTELEARALAQFDSLVDKGELFWHETEEIKVEQQPFDVYFRVSTITSNKPYNPNDTSRKPGFLDDDPEFTLCHVEPNHKLILNKYCWLRPQLILHTRDFQSQTDALSEADFEASCSVLKQLGDRYMIVFNGGPNAGSSVAHKHLQVFLKPEWKTIADDILDGTCNASLPFQYRLTKLSANLTAQKIYGNYQHMCSELSISSGDAHNVILVKDWLMVVPRSLGTIRGEMADAPLQGGANALVGMLWLKSNEQLENWERYGPMKALKHFVGGLPASD